MNSYTRLIASVAVCFVATLVSCASGPDTKTVADSPTAEGSAIGMPAEPVFVEVTEWKLLSEVSSYPDGVVSGSLEREYGSDGLMLAERLYDGKKNLISERITMIDGPDRHIVELRSATGEVQGKNVRELKDGLVVKDTAYDVKGVEQTVETTSWNAEGRRVLWTVTTPAGSSIATSYTYEDGLLVQADVSDSGGNLLKRFVKKYDDSGRIVSDDELDDRGNLVRRVAYERKDGVLLREVTRNSTGSIASILEYEYDSDGNPATVVYRTRTNRIIEKRSQRWQPFTKTVQVN